MNKIVTSEFFLPFMTALCLLLSTLPATSALAEIALRNVDVAGRGFAQAPEFGAAGPLPLSPGMTFVVTKVADTADGVCNADCSFREAIIAANANPGLDNITFNIGTGLKTIFPLSILPLISDPVNLDATTQPGFSGTPLIEIDGSNAGVDAYGLRLSASNSTIRGFIISGFRLTGLSLFKGDNLVAGNFIGTNAAGTAVHPGTQNNGVGMEVASSNNIIGGTSAADKNVIAGNKNQNSSRGLILRNAATGNKVIGNYIGTDVTGTINLGHDNEGILLYQAASGNTIGGPTAAERNIIAAKQSSIGIGIYDASSTK